MPISVPGSSRLPRGFTLIELLLVTLLIGISITLVSISLSAGDRHLEVEAKRLAALLDHAALRARTTGVSLAWQAQERGYRFLSREETWRELPQTGDEILRARSLPEDVSIDLVAPATDFAPASSADPLTVRDKAATVVFPATGLASRFSLRIVGAGGAAFHIDGDLSGRIDLAREAKP